MRAALAGGLAVGLLFGAATSVSTEQDRAEQVFHKGYEAAVRHSVNQRYGDFFERYGRVIVSERFGNPSMRCSISGSEMTARCDEVTYIDGKPSGRSYRQIPVTDDEMRIMKKIAVEK